MQIWTSQLASLDINEETELLQNLEILGVDILIISKRYKPVGCWWCTGAERMWCAQEHGPQSPGWSDHGGNVLFFTVPSHSPLNSLCLTTQWPCIYIRDFHSYSASRFFALNSYYADYILLILQISASITILQLNFPGFSRVSGVSLIVLVYSISQNCNLTIICTLNSMMLIFLSLFTVV